MGLRIRLRKQGRKNRAVYRVVVADNRSPRDGKYIECVGWYDPCAQAEDKRYMIQEEKVAHWVSVGAQMTPTVASLVKRACCAS